MPGTAKSPGGTDRRTRSTAGRQDVLGCHYNPPACQNDPQDFQPAFGPPVTSLEASRSILARSGQGSATAWRFASPRAAQPTCLPTQIPGVPLWRRPGLLREDEVPHRFKQVRPGDCWVGFA